MMVDSVQPFMMNGRGWWSPELADLMKDFVAAEIRRACDELGMDPRRQNVEALRRYLTAGEARLK
jgi:hypothetical protein